MNEVVTLGYGAALLMGLSFGAGPCNITCLPFLGPVLMASERGAWRHVGWFSLGRLLAYTLLGLVAGFIGLNAAHWLDPDFGGVLLGVATLAIGVSLWRRRPQACASTGHYAAAEQAIKFHHPADKKPVSAPGLLFMGLGMGLNPCAPLGMVLVAAAATGSVWLGASLGLVFGLGAVLLPTFLFATLMAHFGQQLRQHMLPWQGPVQKAAAVLLMTLGILTALGLVRV